MSDLLQSVRAAAHALDNAVQHRDEAIAASTKQRSRATELRGDVDPSREKLIDSQVAALSAGETPATVTAEVLLAPSVEAEAAERFAEQLEMRARDANTAVQEATAKWHKAVQAYALDLEEAAIRDVEAAVGSLSAACARGIAAAVIVRDYGLDRGRHMPRSHWFGPAGQLVERLREIKWPTNPRAIEPCGFWRQWVNESVTTHPGVADETARIREAIGEEG